MTTLLAHLRSQLLPFYSEEEARSLAHLVLEDGLGVPLSDIYAGKVIKLSEEKEQILAKIIARLTQHEPIQYILGHTEFDGQRFYTSPGVLIPRPETEELVDWITEQETPHRLLDIGTGSGCIALSLARHFPKAEVDAWDISDKALVCARQNAISLNVKAHFFQRDVLRYQPTEEETSHYDLLVSNPPYVAEREKASMEANVLDWEPSEALFVPDDNPLLFYKAIARLGHTLLKEGGKLYFEINPLYAEAMRTMLLQEEYNPITIRKDLFGRERMLSATLTRR